MATPTKSQLATENAALRCRVSELEGEVARLKEQRYYTIAYNAALAARQDDWKRRAAAAREEAMRTGRPVRLEPEGEVARLKEQLTKSSAARQDDWKQRAAAAREEAMRTGRPVRF